MAQNTKQVRLILRNEIVLLEGTPEELATKISNYKLLDSIFADNPEDTAPDWGTVVEVEPAMDNVIQFPQRGRFAHPSHGHGA